MIQELEVTEFVEQWDMKVEKGKEPRAIVGFLCFCFRFYDLMYGGYISFPGLL